MHKQQEINKKLTEINGLRRTVVDESAKVMKQEDVKFISITKHVHANCLALSCNKDFPNSLHMKKKKKKREGYIYM